MVEAVQRRLPAEITRKHVAVGLAVVALVFGAALRLVGSNWDEGKHLHPDDRFISSVADNTHWPGAVNYFQVESSGLNPYNTSQGQGYIYGTLPLFATKLVATGLGDAGYGTLNIVGRRLAALLDTLTIVLVFFIALQLLDGFGRHRAVQGAILASLLYAFAVTAIQHSHFFTTDAWLVFFGTLTFLLALRAIRSGTDEGSRRLTPLLPLLGVALGLTVACKVSGVLVLLPVLLALAGRSLIIARWAGLEQALARFVLALLTVGLTAYIAFRAASPYVFAHSSWLDLTLNQSFRDALDAQRQAASGAGLYPPAYQWLLSPRIWSPFENLMVWQLGIPFGIAALVGLAALVVRIGRTVLRWIGQRGSELEAPEITKLTAQSMVVGFSLTVFLYFGAQFVHSGRYLLPMVPVLAVAAAYGVVALTSEHTRLRLAVSGVLVAATALYAVAFTHVYIAPNTRLAATDWLNEHVPAGATIANEHWDDPLPVGGLWIDPATGTGLPGAHRGLVVPVFDPDDAKKLRTLYDSLSVADYYVLSSPRAWNTIGRLPDRFPIMTRFYGELFAERLGFERAKEFTSYPQLFGIELRDGGAEEAFSVYDHPRVLVFRRAGSLSWHEFKAALCPRTAPPQCS
jgi:Dolichyl-phosphate-mannose-protein mannosyltransferase